MAKNNSNVKLASPLTEGTAARTKKRVLPTAQRAEGKDVGFLESPAQSLAGTQVYSSEEQAIEVLLENVVGRMADESQDQREMREFLSVILDTDPTLKQEILQATTIRK